MTEIWKKFGEGVGLIKWVEGIPWFSFTSLKKAHTRHLQAIDKDLNGLSPQP